MHFVLGMNAFGAGDERIRGGDERFSAGDERIENARSSVGDTQTASYQRIPNKIYVEMIAIVTATYL